MSGRKGHLAMAEQERRDRGETSREAKQNARRELGNELLIKGDDPRHVGLELP